MIVTFIRRSKYLGYYLKTLDRSKYSKFNKHVRDLYGLSSAYILFDILISVYRYNIGIIDYFVFRFFEKKDNERIKWAGTGFMYEYQLRMNPTNAREILENKILFLTNFNPYVKRHYADIQTLKASPLKLDELLLNNSGKLVLKGSHGQVGAEVEVVPCSEYSHTSLLDYMKRRKYDLVEEYVIQHPLLMELSPSGLNTVRIFTQLHNGKVDFLGARLRVSVNSPIDNMAAGNLAAPIDMETGVVCGPGVYSDITKADQAVHPITGKEILSFKVPFWPDVKEFAKEAALLTPGNRSVGWDIAITSEGPELIEGNHNWCKILWQLPVKEGLKNKLDKYLW